MKDLIILLLLFGLLWGGYKGMIYLNSFTQETKVAETISTEKNPADKSEKRLNQSAIKEMKKGKMETRKKETPAAKEPTVKATTPPSEVSNGLTNSEKQSARQDTRLDIEGKSRSKEDFYSESVTKESKPYERKSGTSTRETSTTNASDLKDQKTAMAEKGKALAGEFTAKGNTSRSTAPQTTFNIETGKKEIIEPSARPKEYTQVKKRFIPSRYVLVVGSFANADNAVKEVLRLKKRGYSKANIVLSDKSLNLVSLGSFSDQAAAKARAAQIKRAGIDVFVKGIR